MTRIVRWYYDRTSIFLRYYLYFVEGRSIQKLIKNEWRRQPGEAFALSKILCHEDSPEGLDIERIRFDKPGRLQLNPAIGHIISILKGETRLLLTDNSLNLVAGMHLYIPPFVEIVFDAKVGTELLHVSSPSAAQTRGEELLLRDERFLAACSSGSQSLRWILTPQYLSRRIFLHHDKTLLSKSLNPISWFHTTMFDVKGLPKNEDGYPVFKMSYNSRTEINVCYDVKGSACVRMAQHPYREAKQSWDQWLPIDGDSTYHLNEAAGSPEEECCFDATNQTSQTFRNKHEVHIVDGHVSLFCMFDPAPTGVERHRPGEYSDYEPLSQVLGTMQYETHIREITKYDEMVDRLSLAKAMGKLSSFQQAPAWELYLRGLNTQIAIESELSNNLSVEGKGRERVIEPWMTSKFLNK